MNLEELQSVLKSSENYKDLLKYLIWANEEEVKEEQLKIREEKERVKKEKRIQQELIKAEKEKQRREKEQLAFEKKKKREEKFIQEWENACNEILNFKSAEVIENELYKKRTDAGFYREICLKINGYNVYIKVHVYIDTGLEYNTRIDEFTSYKKPNEAALIKAINLVKERNTLLKKARSLENKIKF